jgi:hypothetical protein
MLKTIMMTCILIASSAVQANLYHCDKPNGKLTPVENKNFGVEFKTQNAKWFQTALDDLTQYKEKIPFLIYYAIDTPEPFMKYSVEYETRRLKENCYKKQNFAIVLNTKYLNENIIEICKEGILQNINLNDFPKLTSILAEKRKFIGKGDHESNDLGPMKYLVKYKDITKNFFRNVPTRSSGFFIFID